MKRLVRVKSWDEIKKTLTKNRILGDVYFSLEMQEVLCGKEFEAEFFPFIEKYKYNIKVGRNKYVLLEDWVNDYIEDRKNYLKGFG